MQAIILAAGMGKRLGELTQDNTKCMIKVNGIPLIDRMLDQIDKRNFKRVVMVIGYEGEKLIKHIETLNIKTPIIYVNNPVYDQTNNIYSLYLAKEQLEEDDTVLFESDLIFEDAVLDKIIEHPYPNLALVAKFQSWMDGTSLVLDEEDRIERFISTNSFKFEDIPNYFKTVNIYKFSKKFSVDYYVPFLEAYLKALGTNEYYEQVLKVITYLDDPQIKALRLGDEFWYEIDDIQDLDIAESIFAKKEAKLAKIETRFGGYWRYPKLIDFCYLVNPYFPNEKLKSEIKANFDTLIAEYPSGMRVNSLLAGKNFNLAQEHIVVGNGAAELINSLLTNLAGTYGVIKPTFEEYPNRLTKENIIGFTPHNSSFSYDADDVINYFGDKAIDALILINPDNPSGNFIPYQDLIRICNWAKEKKIWMIIDESFVDFSEESIENSLLSEEVLTTYKNLIVIKSISKSYGVPGLRLGILACADESLIAKVKKNISIWNINSFAEFFLQIYSKYAKSYVEGCHQLAAERKRFMRELTKVPYLRPIPSQANYILCEVLPPYTSKGITTELLDTYNLFIKDCSHKDGFDGRQYVRIAVRDAKDDNKLLLSLKDLKIS